MSLDLADGGLAPYLILIVFGFLPSEIWRWLSVGVARRLDEESPVFLFARTVAAVLLVGVVARLILTPAGDLASVPLAARLGALCIAGAAYLAFRKSVMAALLAGEAAIMSAAYFFSG